MFPKTTVAAEAYTKEFYYPLSESTRNTIIVSGYSGQNRGLFTINGDANMTGAAYTRLMVLP